MDYEADVASVSFSKGSLKVLRRCLYPQNRPVNLHEELELLGKYRKLSDQKKKNAFWNKLRWKKKLVLFKALDEDEKFILLSHLSVKALNRFLVGLPQGDLLELRLINERCQFFTPQ